MEKKIHPTIIILIFLCSFSASYFIDSLWRQQDDAYITYTYARRIAEGDGFTYSPGAPSTYGTTTPLYTLILAFICWVGVPPHIASPLFNSFLHGSVAALFATIGTRLVGRFCGISLGILWCIQLATYFRTGGMETALLLMLTSIALWICINFLTMNGGGFFLGIVSGLLILTRPDASILVLTIFLFLFIRSESRTKIILHLALSISLILAPWIFYALWDFGTIIPSSLHAKLLHRGRISGEVSLVKFYEYFLPIPGNTFALAIFMAIFCYGSSYIWRKFQMVRPFVLWVPLYYLILTSGKAPDFAWYYVPPFPIILLVIVVGVKALSDLLVQRRQLFLIPALSIICIISIYANYLATMPLFSGEVLNTHFLLANRISELSEPGEMIASTEVGHLGYWNNRPILDLLGLISPNIQPFLVHWDHEGIMKKFNPEWALSVSSSSIDFLSRNYFIRDSFPYVALGQV